MLSKQIRANSQALDQEIQWFQRVLETRLQLHFGKESQFEDILDISPPPITDSESTWAKFLDRYKPDVSERLAILLGLIPHIQPQILDIFFAKNAQFDRVFSEFGGKNNQQSGGFMPTGETLLFLLGGSQTEARVNALQLFQSDHFFAKDQILTLSDSTESGYPLKSRLVLSTEWVNILLLGEDVMPVFTPKFPLREMERDLEETDLVLETETRRQIDDIRLWIEHRNTLREEWGMKGVIKTAYSVLFHGINGSGKKTAAVLLGKLTGQKVYEVEPSLLQSSHIDESVARIASLFRSASLQNGILYFDEADALFGKRTNLQPKNTDSFNQQLGALLLTHLEGFAGVVIFATESVEDLDERILRRFHKLIRFAILSVSQRLQLWQQNIPEKATLADDVNLAKLAQDFELNAGSIVNVISDAALQALASGTDEITLMSLRRGIRKELVKMGKIV